jgi:hypothetical protein
VGILEVRRPNHPINPFFLTIPSSPISTLARDSVRLSVDWEGLSRGVRGAREELLDDVNPLSNPGGGVDRLVELEEGVKAGASDGTGGRISTTGIGGGGIEEIDFLRPNNRLNPFFPTDPVFAGTTISSFSSGLLLEEVEDND